MRKTKKLVNSLLVFSLLSINAPEIAFISSNAYASTKVDVSKVISNLVVDLKRSSTEEEKKAKIASYSAILANASKREIESALRKADHKILVEYKRTLKTLDESDNSDEVIGQLMTIAVEDHGASWAGCGVAVTGAILVGVGVVLAIVAFTKKTNEDRIRENARQARLRRTKTYEDEVYFLNNAVSITEDKIDNLETNISQAEQDLSAVNAKIDLLTDQIINAGDDVDVEGLKLDREEFINQRENLTVEIGELREDLQTLNNQLSYYLIEENIEFELEQAEFDLNQDIARITETEEADVGLIELRKKERKNLLIASGITAGLGAIGASSLGDCSDF